jgi:hypothetical protein
MSSCRARRSTNFTISACTTSSRTGRSATPGAQVQEIVDKGPNAQWDFRTNQHLALAPLQDALELPSQNHRTYTYGPLTSLRYPLPFRDIFGGNGDARQICSYFNSIKTYPSGARPSFMSSINVVRTVAPPLQTHSLDSRIPRPP